MNPNEDRPIVKRSLRLLSGVLVAVAVLTSPLLAEESQRCVDELLARIDSNVSMLMAAYCLHDDLDVQFVAMRRSYQQSKDGADDALELGIKSYKERKYKEAIANFEEAIRLAPSEAFLVGVYERAMPLYEKQASIDKLIKCHLAMQNSVSGTASTEAAHNVFYNSLVRFLNHTTGRNASYSTRSDTKSSPDMNRVEVPASVALAISKSYQLRRAQRPAHEPTLRILETFHSDVRKDKKKLLNVLIDRDYVLRNRDERLDFDAERTLAALYVEFGEPEKGALIYQNNNKRSSRNSANASQLVPEAKAWLAAGKKDKAMRILKRAAMAVKKTGGGRRGEAGQVGDLYMEIDMPQSAIPLFQLAIGAESSESKISEWQGKLEDATNRSQGNVANGAPNSAPATGAADDISDVYRKTARTLEIARTDDPEKKFNNLFGAAENWLKANETQKAKSALKKASKTLRRMRFDFRVQRSHEKIANVYLDLEMNQEALDQFARALSISNNERDIEKYQREISALVAEDEKLKVPAEIAGISDPNFATRAQAKKLESDFKTGNRSQLANLIKAAELWGKAGDVDNLKRSGQRAAAEIRNAARRDSGSSRTKYSELHEKLAVAFEDAKEYELAIENLLEAMWYKSDAGVRENYEAIKKLCNRHNLKLPKLKDELQACLLYTSPSPRDQRGSRMPSSA